jgi:hypothetical protein
MTTMHDAIKTIDELKTITAKLLQTPSKLQAIAASLPVVELTRVTPEGPWAIGHHLCHLRDFEREGVSVRIRKILGGSSPSLADFDGEKLAIDRAYGKQDPMAALADFTIARGATIASLMGVIAADLARTGTLEKVGAITLGRLLSMTREHDDEHIAQIEAVRNRIGTQRRETIQL